MGEDDGTKNVAFVFYDFMLYGFQRQDVEDKVCDAVGRLIIWCVKTKID